MTPPARTTLSLIACGVVLAGALGAAGQIDARGEAGRFVALMMVAASAYVAALRLVWRGPAAGGGAFAACVLLAVVARAAIAGGAPLVSDDVYRYLWDGRVQQFGLSPYEAAPVDPALAGIHTEATRRIDPTSAVLPSLYPPLAQRFFLVVTAVDDSVAAMVAAVVVCDLLTLLVLWRWLVTSGRNRWWVLAYAWHPLVILEGAAGAHVDAVGTLLVATAAWALARRRSLAAAMAIAGAVAVKFLPLVLLPLLWRRVRLRHAAVAGAGVALLYLPFMQPTGVLPIGSLATYAAQWRFNGPLFRWIEAWVGVPGAVAAAVGAGLAAAVLARRRLPPDAPAAWAWPLGVTVALMPAVYPWYLVWMTPFLTSRAVAPLVVWTLVAPLTYLVWTSHLAGRGWFVPGWVELVEYGLVAGAAVWLWAGGRWRGASVGQHAAARHPAAGIVRRPAQAAGVSADAGPIDKGDPAGPPSYETDRHRSAPGSVYEQREVEC